MVVRRNPRVISERLVGEQGTVLLHLDSGASYRLNEVGALIWDLIAEPLRVGALRDRLAAAVVDSAESLEADLSEFLHGLTHRGLIGMEPGGSG